jgi:Cytochrome domain of cellobiose dehydrogenase/Eukaryotic cytochrome b561
MLDALIFVAYKSENGKNVTVSPRIGLFHAEPQYTNAVGIDVLEGSYVDDATYNINARCTNCRSWPISSRGRGKISITSTAQPMLYAIGGAHSSLQNDSRQAKIRAHLGYGMFKMNLRSATGKAGIPSHTISDTSISHGKVIIESRFVTVTHGLIMAICFVVLFPTGALLTRLPFRLAFWLHLICQCSTTLGVLSGSALGIYNSIHSHKYPTLNGPHQILGLITTLLLLVQPTLGFRGFLHNRHHPNYYTAALAGKLHTYLGPIIIITGIINGALGLIITGDPDRLPAYGAACIFVAIVYLVTFWIFRRRSMGNNNVVVVAAAARKCRRPAVHLTPPPHSLPPRDFMSLGDLSLQKSSMSQESGRSQRSGLSSEHSLTGVVVTEEVDVDMDVDVDVEEHTSVRFVCVNTKDEEKRMQS